MHISFHLIMSELLSFRSQNICGTVWLPDDEVRLYSHRPGCWVYHLWRHWVLVVGEHGCGTSDHVPLGTHIQALC
jgi:hypothetical protein